MKLLRLEIQGFKSFKDKTIIHFDEGITGIVGPNGCGKSNIVDALFWVMGEQSAKHLRGNNMKDLIFAGSSKYAPGNWAEVTLVLLNDSGKHIHIGNQVAKPTEIALTRKLYRNGETEYRINGLPARLKDIHEVFMDTGAGAKSYSIIAQGEINRLVQAKPQERRTMIEEVAGITKFKIRKRDSLKKIEHTQSNLNRLEDLQTEIYKNLKALEKQAEKAEKAKFLKEKIKRHELIVKSHKEFDFLNEYVNAKRILENNEIEFEQASLKKDQLELALEDERLKKTDLMEKIDELQAEFNKMSRELATCEERLRHLKRSKQDKIQHIESREKENEELESDILSRSDRLDELKDQLSELESTNYEEIDFSDLEEKVMNLKETLNEKEEEISDLSGQLEDAKMEFTQVDQQVFKNNSKLEEYSANLEDISAEMEQIESSTANFTDELVQKREELTKIKNILAEVEIKHAQLKERLNAKSLELKQKEPLLKELSKEVIQIESKRQSLIEINKSGEGIKQGGLSFIEENGKGNFEILGNIIECESEYAKALEVLFEKTFDSLIGKDASNQNLADWAKLNPNTSFDFIMPFENSNRCGEETIERLRLKGCENVIAIEDILKFNNIEFGKNLRTYFNGFYIVNNLTTELSLKISNDISFKGLVSLDGNVYLVKTLNGIQLSVRNEDDVVLGVVQRNNLINEMTEEYEQKKAHLDNLETEISKLDEEIETLKSEFELATGEFNSINSEFIALKSSLDSRESSSGAVLARLEILKNRKSEISKARLNLLESDEDFNDRKSQLEEKVADLSDILSNSKDALDEIRSTYEEQRSELLSLQANAKTYQSQITSLESQIKDVASQIARYEEKKQSNTDLLEKYNQEIEETELAVTELEHENSNQVEIMSDKENYLNIVKDELTQLLTGMQERENEVKELTSKINKIDKQNVELNLKATQIIADEEILVKDVFDKYRIDLRYTLSKFLEIFPQQLEELADLSMMYLMESENGEIEVEREQYDFEKRFPAVIKESKEKLKRYRTDLNRLGEINWQAVRDYDRQKLRYDFLKNQEGELKKSLEDLTLAIEHIDQKSKERFSLAYNEVNDRFTKVFPIIFGGGEARLEIVGDLDDIECGIEIIAKPPGKKMQSINLMSGGEKAMTAVSLIFSIFLVKPSPFCLLDEVDAPLDDANVGRFNELLREMSSESQFILITHNKKTMELNDTLYGVTMQEPGVSKAVSVQLH